MELGNNKPKDFGSKEIKPPQTEVQKAKEMAEKKWKELGRFGSIFGPAVEAANAFDQKGQKVGNQVNIINNKVTINGKEVSQEEAQKHGIYTGDHDSDLKSVHVGGSLNGVINTGDDNVINIPKFQPTSDIPNPKFDIDEAMESAPFGSKDYNNIHGSVLSGNFIQGTVQGDVIYNGEKQPKPNREAYIAPKEQIEYVRSQDQVTIPTNYEAETIPDPWEGSYKTGNETPTQLPQQERQSTVYNLSREQLAYINSQDKFVQKQEPRIYNSMDDVFEQMVKDWEVAYGVEPIPNVSKNFDNIDEINAVIDRNWKTKFANYKERQPKAEPEVKEVLRKRDKIKNVLKNVGNRIKDKLQKWYDKIDIKIEDDIDFDEMSSPNFYIDNNTESNYSDEELNQAIEILEAEDLDDELDQEAQELKTNPEVVYKGRKNLEDILVSSKPSAWKEDTELDPNAGWRTVKPDEVITPEVVAGRAKLDNLKIVTQPVESISPRDSDGNIIRAEYKFEGAQPIISEEPLPFEVFDSGPEILDVKDQEKFINARLKSLDNLKTFAQLDQEIKNIENGNISIPDLVANESDYEDLDGTPHAVDKNGNISPQRLIDISDYQDARDINMLKTAEILTALKQKRDLVSKGVGIETLTEKIGEVFDSRSFSVLNVKGKLVAMVKDPNEIVNGGDPNQYPVIIDERGRLKFTANGGKEYVVNDIQEKILNQKVDEIKASLKTRIDNIK
jgi:hypothetical protein